MPHRRSLRGMARRPSSARRWRRACRSARSPRSRPTSPTTSASSISIAVSACSTQTFLEFSDRMAAAYRIQRGAALIKTYAPVFARIDQQFGVPAPVIVAFWALESDFGANMGKYRTLSAIASLAYDCRRADRFRAQLLDALRLIQRGDLRPAGHDRLVGRRTRPDANDAVGILSIRGRLRRRRHSAIFCAASPDVLGSTANYLVGLGWRRGEPWLTEVRVPANMPWEQADLDDQAAARQMGRRTASRSRTAGRCPRTICRRRCCLPMGRLWLRLPGL